MTKASFTSTKCAILCALLVAAASGCSDREAGAMRARPTVVELSTLGVIRAAPENPVVDVAGLSDCRVLLADQRGDLTIIESDGRKVRLGTIPGGRAIRLEPGDANRMIAWANSPPWLARISIEPFEIESISVPLHHWGGAFVGPAVDLEGRVAMAPLANPGRSHQGRRGTADARLIEVLDPSGGNGSSIGPSLPGTPDYESWRAWRGELSRVADTLLFISFADGVVHRHLISDTESIRPDTLPAYFRPVKPRIDVLRFPWIQFGNFPYFVETPQVSLATFGIDGTLYAVRPYGYRWISRPNRYVRDAGNWEPTSQALELYSTSGELIGAYLIPRELRQIQVDEYGRIFLIFGNDVLIARNPISQNQSCAYPNSVLARMER